jgi:hypothetical protein
MDDKLRRIKQLIEEKERIDSELEGLINGTVTKVAKQRTCKICGEPGHNSKGCPSKQEGAAA